MLPYIVAIGKSFNYISYAEGPFLLHLVPYGSYLLLVEELQFVLCHTVKFIPGAQLRLSTICIPPFHHQYPRAKDGFC